MVRSCSALHAVDSFTCPNDSLPTAITSATNSSETQKVLNFSAVYLDGLPSSKESPELTREASWKLWHFRRMCRQQWHSMSSPSRPRLRPPHFLPSCFTWG